MGSSSARWSQATRAYRFRVGVLARATDMRKFTVSESTNRLIEIIANWSPVEVADGAALPIEHAAYIFSTLDSRWRISRHCFRAERSSVSMGAADGGR